MSRDDRKDAPRLRSQITRQRKKRRSAACLDDDEPDQQRACRREETERDRRAPAVLSRLGETVDQADQPGGDGQRPGNVVARFPLGPALPHDRQCGGGCEQRDRDVDQQAPAPGGVLGQHAAEDEPERGAATGDRAINTEGAGTFSGLGERDRDEGERCRRENRGECSLQRTGGEQERGVRSEAADRRCRGETKQTTDKGALSPDEVGDPAAEKQQATECQGVRGDDPLPISHGNVQIGLGLGHGDVHDGRIEHYHQLSHGNNCERKPSLGVDAAPGLRSDGSR